MNSRLGSRQYSIIILTLITAVIHLVLGVGSLPDSLGYIFILNAFGYLVLLAALYFIPQLESQRGPIRWVFIAYTALTFVLYFVFNWPDIWGSLGLLDKAAELVLIVLLFLDRHN